MTYLWLLPLFAVCVLLGYGYGFSRGRSVADRRYQERLRVLRQQMLDSMDGTHVRKYSEQPPQQGEDTS